MRGRGRVDQRCPLCRCIFVTMWVECVCVWGGVAHLQMCVCACLQDCVCVCVSTGLGMCLCAGPCMCVGKCKCVPRSVCG